MVTSRPVFGLTVLRYADGRTMVHSAYDPASENEWLPVPESWQHRHAMLIDACELVKREAGVAHEGSEP